VPATARKPLEDQDPVVLGLLRLAAEVILANPGTVPPALYDLCDTWADDLAGALSRPVGILPREPTGSAPTMSGRHAAIAGSPLTGARGVAKGASFTTALSGQP
jgi:hypothetical protein